MLLNKRNWLKHFYCLILGLTLCYFKAGAQASLFANTYGNALFENKMFLNPAYAGSNNVWQASGVLRVPVNNNVDGAPKDIDVCVQGPIAKYAGIGFNLYKYSSGIIANTSFSFNYSFAVNLAKESKMLLGVICDINKTTVDQNGNAFNGALYDVNDPLLLTFNSRPPAVNAGIGAVYQNKNIEVQFCLPTCNSFFSKADTIATEYEYAKYNATASYKLVISEERGSYVKLLAGITAYNGVASKNIIHAGAYVDMMKLFSVYAVYNTNSTIGLGLGLKAGDNFRLGLNYTMGGLYSNAVYGGKGVGELCVTINLSKRKNSN